MQQVQSNKLAINKLRNLNLQKDSTILVFKMQNDDLRNKELELERKNKQLEYRKRQIQMQLKHLQHDDYNQQEEEPQQRPESENVIFEDENQDNKEEQQDIINQLESIKKANLQKNQNKLAQFKKQFESNKIKLLKNQQRIQKLQNNIDLAKTAVKMKNQLKQQIESKGKKISEESKKWITQVGKLNDKSQALRTTLVGHQKQEQSLKNMFESQQRKLVDIQREKISYETESKTLNSRVQNLKAQIQKAKQLIKQKQIVSKEQNQKSQKEKQKIALNQKRLQRQKNQLIKAYKKLSQYISLLRKCNTHLQTANSLGFGLKEYLQAIDKTDMIA